MRRRWPVPGIMCKAWFGSFEAIYLAAVAARPTPFGSPEAPGSHGARRVDLFLDRFAQCQLLGQRHLGIFVDHR
jgi:hypothetical protein